MNIENINKLIERLKADDGSHFKMGEFFEYLDPSRNRDASDATFIECGTACCLAGWINALRDDEVVKSLKGYDFRVAMADVYSAGNWLGLAPAPAHELFYPGGYGPAFRREIDSLFDNQRRLLGICVLEHLRDTGDVDWKRAYDSVTAA